jgi:hypothetical protein
LPRHLERRLDRLRSATDEIDVVEAGRGVFDEAVGETLGCLSREERGVGVGERVELLVQRRNHVGVAVAEAGDGGAARGVEITAPAGVDNLEARPRDGDGHDGVCGAVQNVRHR